MTNRAVHVVITGRVQGVGFRAWIEREADSRGVSGWVRNRRNGAVEALFSGPAAAVEGMVAACYRGPDLADVDEVKLNEAAPETIALTPPGVSFAVIATA
jgi:acylphosphatase